MFGTNALYIRLPSEQRSAVVHRVCLDDVHQDLLAARDKPLYAKYKGGTMETGETFDSDVTAEQIMIDDGFKKLSEFEKVQEYVSFVNEELQNKLLVKCAHVLPASPSSSDADGGPTVCPPVPPIGTDPPGRRRGGFVYPDRRLRAKTSPPPSQDLEELVQAAEEATAAELVEESRSPDIDFSADAEAAVSMGLD